MQIFRSLNCCLCSSPFVASANSSQSPQKLICGETICQECFEREKPLAKAGRKHQCNASKYNKEFDCFAKKETAFFLIDLLLRGSLALISSKTGYAISKSLSMPECPICHEGYSCTILDAFAYDLDCGHLLCKGCYEKDQLLSRSNTIKCSICQQDSHDIRLSQVEDSYFAKFLRELPEMLKQFEQTKHTMRECVNCKTLNHVASTFCCEECENRIICATCGILYHKNHELSEFIVGESKHISKKVEKSLEQQIGGYVMIFTELHNEVNKIMQLFKEKIILKANALASLRSIEAMIKVEKNAREIGNKFESISEEYMPYHRDFRMKILELIKEIGEDALIVSSNDETMSSN